MVVFTCCRNSGGGVSLMLVFFFKQRTAYEMRISDWSSDVCSSDRVADRVDFRLVEPGPLPFAAGRFDAVFSKDALIHIPDKQGLYAEVLRVLRPGGAFAASDWLARSEEHTSELQSLMRISYAVFCLKKKKNK